MTLVEMLVSMALMVVLFAAIVPQIRAIQNSWTSKRGNAENAEAIHNGGVLMDHITFNLTQAQKITAVSDSSDSSGYIEFEDNDGNVMRYEIGAGNYVEFGPVGDVSELAGPASQLQFTCYDACDLDTPITDVNTIRSVRVQSTFTNSAGLGRDQSFTGQAYLRTNALGGGDSVPTVGEEAGSELEFDAFNGEQFSLLWIDATNYLCAYAGLGPDGYAVILTVDTNNWTISAGTAFEFENGSCVRPALARIDATHYLCAYTGPQGDGWAVILTVNTVTKTISEGVPFEFDGDNCEIPALSRIDSDNFLCAYSGKAVAGKKHGWAVILTVNTILETITMGTPFEFDASAVFGCALTNIDDVHHLCTYGFSEGGAGSSGARAIVLTTNVGGGTISKESSFDFDTVRPDETEMGQIDQNHYLCAYDNPNGYAVVLTVDTGTWAIGKGARLAFGEHAHSGALAQRDEDDFFCAYGSNHEYGYARVLRTDTGADNVTSGPRFQHDAVKGKTPDVAKVDDTHFLCVYTGAADDGFAVILTVGAPILP
jgi:competence protein ComGC